MKIAMTVSGLFAALVLHGSGIVATVDTPVNDRYVLPQVCGKYGSFRPSRFRNIPEWPLGFGNAHRALIPRKIPKAECPSVHG